ncbi:Gfo/Idh/MocA family protein [Nocardioides solisilvae]|uniref:Gfo/Idh/MocA family protein n=1 Tax=Nocardioides solisilvae TaxID=1542435 RepID=UPI000D74904B|nr:Gfo/Idh/MocA family oxidoreductase [Nocardioides solisilvae]
MTGAQTGTGTGASTGTDGPRLRWAILGAGGISRRFARDLLLDGGRVQAVGSRDLATAQRFVAELVAEQEADGLDNGLDNGLDAPTAHAGYEALVADPHVDAVYVGTPHSFHHEHALLALRAGKHVLVEKPFTISAAQARAVVAEAEARGLVALEAMWTRFLPHMARLRELVADGTLGEVTTVIADHSQRLPDDPAHRLQDPALGGGALLDLGVYPVSFAHDLLGVPETIDARSTPTPTGVDRQTSVLLGYADGRQAVLHTALDVAGRNDAVVLGTRARVELAPTWYNPTTLRVVASDGTLLEEYDGLATGRAGGRGMQHQARELERLVREGSTASPLLPPEATVAVMETLDEVRRLIGLAYPGE